MLDEFMMQITLYKIYKEKWFIEHKDQVTPEDRLNIIGNYNLYNLYSKDVISFEEYLFNNNGFNGLCYSTLHEFIDCEYNEPDYIEELISSITGDEYTEKYKERLLESYNYYQNKEKEEDLC